MNDLIERYLQAIGFWLPERDDILAEISEDIQSQIADEENALRRSLTESETEALLKRRGRPMLVANGYRPQRSLVGPVLFPIYVLVLKAALVCGILPWIAVWFVVARVQHPDMGLGTSLFVAWGTFCRLTFFIAGVVTLLFAVLQWSEARAHFLDRWNPRQLPPVRDPDKISFSSAVTELTANVVFLVLWLVYARSPTIFDGATFKLGLTSTWTLFFWGFLVVTLCNIGMAVAQLRARHWTCLRAIVRMLLDLIGGALFCCLMKAHLVATLYSAGLGNERSVALMSAINLWMDRCFPFAVIVTAIAITVDAVRLFRVSKTKRANPARAFAILIIALLFTAAARSQQASPNVAANSSMPTDSALRAILADRIDVQHKSFGTVVALTEPGGRRVVAYGQTKHSDPSKISGDTVFEIGSVTKIFTALLLEDMVQRGEVSLSDPVAKYLPPEVKVPERNGHAITLLDIATQTSGLPFFPTDVPLNDPEAAELAVSRYSTAKMYAFLSHYQLTRDIGSKWEYSNLGYALLGDALARRSGMDYESLMKTRITGPLGMKNTSIAIAPAMRSRLASGYDASLKPAHQVDMPAFLAAGGLHSTANDLLIFLDAFLGRKQTPLSAAMRSMLTPRRPGPGFQQALGWWVMSFGNADDGFFFHGGETPGFSSSLAFDPRSGVGLVVLSNSNANDGGLAWHLMRPAFPMEDSASAKAREQQTKNEVALDSAVGDLDAGVYRVDSGPGAGELIRIERSGDRLVMKTSSTPPEGFRLHTSDNHSFFVTETDLRVKFDGEPGKVPHSLTVQFAGSATVAQRTQ